MSAQYHGLRACTALYRLRRLGSSSVCSGNGYLDSANRKGISLWEALTEGDQSDILDLFRSP